MTSRALQSRQRHREFVKPRERHIDFVNQYLIPWYIVSHRHEGARKPCDGEMRFQSEKGNIFVFHFHLDRMKSYLQRVCQLFCRSENKQISDKELESMAQNLLNDLTSNLHRRNPAIGREILFWVYSRRCMIRKPIDVNDVLNFVFSMGLKDLRDMIINNALHSMRPEVSLPVVCTFHSALLDYRLPEKFRVGLHLHEQDYYHVEETNCPTDKYFSSLLKYSDVGTYYKEEDEQTSDFLSDDYVESRGKSFTVRGPGSVISFEAFVRYLTDITYYSHLPFELQPQWPKRERYHESEDDSESEIDLDLIEVVQGDLNISLHEIDTFRLQILSNDHIGIRQAVSMATAEDDKVTYSFTVDDPDIFFDMSFRQPFFTIYPSSIGGLVRFMRAYVDIGTAWRFGLQIRRPSTETMERMMRAVKIVGFYSLFYYFYIVQSDKESMLKVVEKLADESENPFHSVGGPLTILEVPDLKFLRRSESE